MTHLTKKTNPVIKKAQELREQGRAELVNLETFTKALNRKPAVIKTNKFQNGAKYVPISHIQTLLDTLFFGLWETQNFKYSVVGNEICASIELRVFHPVIKDWIVRTGAAATQIRQNKGASISDIDAKIKNALEMDLPHVMADCVKSAAKTLGPAFGRDLNRDFVDDYKALVSKHVESHSYNLEEVAKKLQEINTTSELLNYHDSNPVWKSDEELNALFEERKSEILRNAF